MHTSTRDLRVPPTKVNQLEVKRRNDEPIQEIWFLMLDAWVGVKGNEAKLSVLIKILDKPNYSARDAADKLKEKFLFSDDGWAPMPSVAFGSCLAAAVVACQRTSSGVPTPDLDETTKQREHIDRNFVALIEFTQVNVDLTGKLIELGVLSSIDVQKMKAQPIPSEQAEMFYTIIKTKNNFYQHLITALELGKQSGAVEILKRIH